MKNVIRPEEAPAAETHFRRKARRPARALPPHRRHAQPPQSLLKLEDWHGLEPHFAPDFAVLLLITGGLMALLSLLKFLLGVHLITPGQLPGHPVS